MSFAVIGTRREAAAAIEIHIEAELADRRNEVRSEVAFVVLVDLTIIIGKRFLHLMIDGFQRLGGCVAEDIEHQGGAFRPCIAGRIALAGGTILLQPLLADSQKCARSEEHTSELQSLMHISYAVFCLKKKNR